MSRRLLNRILVVVCLVMAPSYASAEASTFLRPFLSQEAPLSLSQLRENTDLYDCGLEQDDQEFCSDEIRYYKTRVVVTLLVGSDTRVTKVKLSADFSPIHYTDLQLNLRKDGFHIVEVRKSGRHFLVAEEIRLADRQAVDRALIEFMNQGAIDDPIEVRWQLAHKTHTKNKEVEAVFRSHNENIEVTFYVSKDSDAAETQE
ncbi:hypothetical protein ACP43V_01895 [Vibrio genomosp. F10 str. 9ZC157]|uniref:hypothetical protein n=1 Tax=Vibrio genomosp. F10 TaxID=723171 RepID=UPI0002F5FA2F|nr:hypothetical protein [Vibrio genomosp. F10]OEE98060.1 hypothetical protein A1QM_02320 [Vibrio genomosp. F10 str. 9ZC157]